MGSLDQRLVQAARQLAQRKLSESAREGCFAGKLPGAFPAAQPAQLLVHRKPLDQHRGRRQPDHRLGHKGARERGPVARRSTRQSGPDLDKRLDASNLKRRHHLLVRLGERPEFLRQPGEKITLNGAQVLDRKLSRGMFASDSAWCRHGNTLPNSRAGASKIPPQSRKFSALLQFCKWLGLNRFSHYLSISVSQCLPYRAVDLSTVGG